MAKVLAARLAVIFALLVAIPTVLSYSKKITMYGLTINDGPNANVIPVAGNTIFVFNVRLTEDSNPGSPPIGHARGIFAVSSSMEGAYYLSSVSFEDGEYKGSSLELQGTLAVAGLGYEGELAVVGGTNSLSSVTGYSPQRTILQIPGTNNTIVQLDIFLKFDNHI